MKFEDCAPKVRILHDIYGFGKIYRRNMENGGSVFVDFNGIKRIFFDNKNKDIPYHVSELKRVPKNTTLSTNQTVRYLKSDNVRKIYKELKEKYNIPEGYEDRYTFTVNRSIYVFYKPAVNKQEIVVSAKCHPDDKFDVHIGLEVAVKRLAEKLGIFEDKIKEEEKLILEEGQKYWSMSMDGDYVYSSYYLPSYLHKLDVAMGNCFKTKKEAEANIDKVKEKYKKIFEYAKTLNT